MEYADLVAASWPEVRNVCARDMVDMEQHVLLRKIRRAVGKEGLMNSGMALARGRYFKCVVQAAVEVLKSI